MSFYENDKSKAITGWKFKSRKRIIKNKVYIESGDVRGFVEKKYLDNSDETKQQITTTGEEQYKTAEETVKNKADGITATGTPVVEGQTIAVDPRVIPYGTKVIIGGHIFTAEDCGGAIQGNHIDIYVNNHAEATALGVTNADVFLVK